jgi:hypothetical protein
VREGRIDKGIEGKTECERGREAQKYKIIERGKDGALQKGRNRERYRGIMELREM